MIFRLGNGEGEEESSAPHSRGLFTIRGVGAKRLMALIAPINSCLQASYDLRLKANLPGDTFGDIDEEEYQPG